MLQACLNGARKQSEAAGVPVAIGEIAADAVAVRRAGARELHIHPRSQTGLESLEADSVGACLKAVRAAVPGMPIGIGTGIWIAPTGRERLDLVRDWTELPDYVSINLNEADAPENMELMLSKGIGIEAGIWTAKDAQRFAGLPFKDNCLRILLEMADQSTDLAQAEYLAARGILNDAGVKAPILLHGDGASAWPMVRLAGRHGHDTRAGFEDMVTLPDGGKAQSNEQIVSAAIRLLAES